MSYKEAENTGPALNATPFASATLDQLRKHALMRLRDGRSLPDIEYELFSGGAKAEVVSHLTQWILTRLKSAVLDEAEPEPGKTLSIDFPTDPTPTPVSLSAIRTNAGGQRPAIELDIPATLNVGRRLQIRNALASIRPTVKPAIRRLKKARFAWNSAFTLTAILFLAVAVFVIRRPLPLQKYRELAVQYSKILAATPGAKPVAVPAKKKSKQSKQHKK